MSFSLLVAKVNAIECSAPSFSFSLTHSPFLSRYHFTSFFLSISVRREVSEMADMWQPSVCSGITFYSFDIGSSYHFNQSVNTHVFLIISVSLSLKFFSFSVFLFLLFHSLSLFHTLLYGRPSALACKCLLLRVIPHLHILPTVF